MQGIVHTCDMCTARIPKEHPRISVQQPPDPTWRYADLCTECFKKYTPREVYKQLNKDEF